MAKKLDEFHHTVSSELHRILGELRNAEKLARDEAAEAMANGFEELAHYKLGGAQQSNRLSGVVVSTIDGLAAEYNKLNGVEW